MKCTLRACKRFTPSSAGVRQSRKPTAEWWVDQNDQKERFQHYHQMRERRVTLTHSLRTTRGYHLLEWIQQTRKICMWSMITISASLVWFVAVSKMSVHATHIPNFWPHLVVMFGIVNRQGRFRKIIWGRWPWLTLKRPSPQKPFVSKITTFVDLIKLLQSIRVPPGWIPPHIGHAEASEWRHRSVTWPDPELTGTSKDGELINLRLFSVWEC